VCSHSPGGGWSLAAPRRGQPLVVVVRQETRHAKNKKTASPQNGLFSSLLSIYLVKATRHTRSRSSTEQHYSRYCPSLVYSSADSLGTSRRLPVVFPPRLSLSSPVSPHKIDLNVYTKEKGGLSTQK
jgi:hypothetical protein